MNLHPSTHNFPPPVPPSEDLILADLRNRYPDVETRAAELIDAAKTYPEKIADGDDDTAGKMQALLREMAVAKKSWGATRSIEKGPWQQTADIVFAFFKKPEEDVGKVHDALKARHTDYLERKAATARIEAERKAKLEREAAEKKAKDAAELEERKFAAQQAEEDAAAAAREAAENKDTDEQDLLDLKATLAKAKLARANARRDRNKDAFDTMQVEIARLDIVIEAARAKLAATRRAAKDAQAAAEKQARESAKIEDAHRKAEAETIRTEKRATRAESAAGGSNADMSRTRGEHGTVGSLSGRWTPRVIDRDEIPLDALRGYIHPDAIDAAITRFMRDHQTGWAARRDKGSVADALKGVVFDWVPEGRIV